MKYLYLLVLVFTFSSYAKQPSELMLMGTFHFENPGLDTVKSDTINVMTEENQRYLNELSQKISLFKPTSVLLEFNPDNTNEINKEYQLYLNDSFELPANEIYQIGFRVAKLSGIKQINILDERSIQWQAEELFKYMESTDLQANVEFKNIIKEITDRINEYHKTMTLKQVLKLNNDEQHDRENKNIYLAMNSVGTEDGSFYGADSSATWWHRNFRVYAKIQFHAKTNAKIFALAGQGHTAILKDFIDSDQKIKAVEVPF